MKVSRARTQRHLCCLAVSLLLAAAFLVRSTVLAADVVGQGDVVVVVAATSPTTVLDRNELADLFLGRSAADIKAHWSKVVFTGRGSPPRAVADSEQLRRLIASDPSYMSYLDRSAVDQSLKVVRIE